MQYYLSGGAEKAIIISVIITKVFVIRGEEGMTLINTRSHIVLDKERMQKFAFQLGSTYSAIFELNLTANEYSTLFYTKERFAIGQAGTRKDFIRIAKEHVHEQDVKPFLAMFEKGALQEVIKKDTYSVVEFRCLSEDQEYKWMRVLMIPDEIEKNTVLCFMTDIDAQKRCELLEKKNAELSALVARMSSQINEIEKQHNPVFRVPSAKRQAKSLAVR